MENEVLKGEKRRKLKILTDKIWLFVKKVIYL